ncbi:hypothetical protein JYP51_21875 [Ponticoccus gilvus]|nr:hypothetical protein [Enemella evansiae]
MMKRTTAAAILSAMPMMLWAMGDQPDPDGLLDIEGTLQQGTECPLIVTDSGTAFALSMGDRKWEAGQRVRVHGSLVEMSICMEGEGTIGVSDIDPL